MARLPQFDAVRGREGDGHSGRCSPVGVRAGLGGTRSTANRLRCGRHDPSLSRLHSPTQRRRRNPRAGGDELAAASCVRDPRPRPPCEQRSGHRPRCDRARRRRNARHLRPRPADVRRSAPRDLRAGGGLKAAATSYSPAGGLRDRPLDIATGATLPNDGVSGVAVDIIKVKNGVSVYVNGVRTVRLTGLKGATTSAPRYLAAGVVSYNAPAGADPLTAVHAQVSVTSETTPPVSAAPPPSSWLRLRRLTPVASRSALAPTLPPTISGESVTGSTLSADAGAWTGTLRPSRTRGSAAMRPVSALRSMELLGRGTRSRVTTPAHTSACGSPRHRRHRLQRWSRPPSVRWTCCTCADRSSRHQR